MFYCCVVCAATFQLIKILTGVIKKVVWSKNCAASGVIVMMCWSTAVGGEYCQQFVSWVNGLMQI